MPSSIFRFKHFLIHQEKCPMKVGTDGVLLGAWAGLPPGLTQNKTRNSPGSKIKILDIGTGTGLLALMIAQRICSIKNNPGIDFTIDALDIDESSVKQAIENIEDSKYEKKIRVLHQSLQQFLQSVGLNSYDLIVSNPPFFKNSLKATVQSRNISRHSEYGGLHDEQLIFSVKKLILENGSLCLILPKVEGENFMLKAKKENLFCSKLTRVFSKPNKDCFRYLMQFQGKEIPIEEDILIIETGSAMNDFTEEYKNLTRDFYLGF